MAVKTKYILIISAVVALVCLAVGIVIGHFVIEKSSKTTDNEQNSSKTGSLSTECREDNSFTEEHTDYLNKYLDHSAINACYKTGTCNTFGLPRTYLAYHLNGKTINMDGRLDDEAWEEVPWTELFVVWYDNSFIAYIVPDGSMHNYKELMINVLNTTWDLRLKKPYIDNDGQCPEGEDVADSAWSSDQEKHIYADGGINDPNNTGHSMALVVNESYVKDEEAPVGGWAWQSLNVNNPHFPNRYGLVQFKTDLQDEQFSYGRWHVYKALFEVFIAQKKTRILNRDYSMDLYKLGLPPKILSQECANITMISATRDEFEATVKSRIDTSLPTAHIRQDRYIWFTEN